MTERTLQRGDYWVRIRATGARWGSKFLMTYGHGPGVADYPSGARSLDSALRNANRYLDKMERREQRAAEAFGR